MSAAAILRQLESDGVRLVLSDAGSIKTMGDGDVVNRWIPTIREHKVEIVAALRNNTAPPATVSTDVMATASRWWLIHFVGLDPLECYFTDPATHAEILEWHPNAVAAEPFVPTVRQPPVPLTASEETAIRAWLVLIEETDPATIAEVIDQCQRDADARAYFLGRASELPKPDPDDRRTCGQCGNLRGRVCSVAKPGGLASARRGYEPVADLLHRCVGFAPSAPDPAYWTETNQHERYM